jgi:hypothetical protein
MQKIAFCHSQLDANWFIFSNKNNGTSIAGRVRGRGDGSARPEAKIMISANSNKSVVQLFLAVALASCLSSIAFATNCPSITVDENANGTLNFAACGGGTSPMPGVLAPDPGPGGLPAVLTYDLLGPPNLTAGDVLMTDADAGGAVLDVVRFNPAGTGNPAYPASLLFYSDNVPTSDDLADTSGPPTALYANTFVLPEGTIYTPLVGQPGFVNGFSVT